MTMPPDQLRADLEKIMADHPDLNLDGFQVVVRYNTQEEIDAALAESRAAMLTGSSIAMFAAARAWLGRFPKLTRVSASANSYGLKHIAAPDIGYTFHGLFIAAAIAEGFKVKRTGTNAVLNIGRYALKRARRRAGLLASNSTYRPEA